VSGAPNDDHTGCHRAVQVVELLSPQPPILRAGSLIVHPVFGMTTPPRQCCGAHEPFSGRRVAALGFEDLLGSDDVKGLG
jgi:hypothetical protein